MSTAAFVAEVLDELVQRYGGGDWVPHLIRARAEYEARRGVVREDEELWDSVSQGFLEWYVLERALDDDGAPPAARALAEERDRRRADAIRACLRSQRSLFQVRRIEPGCVELGDLLGGAEFAVPERRALHGVGRGDVVEARIIGLDGQLCFGRAFCFHPSGTAEAILGHLRRLRALGRDKRDAIDFIAALRVRCDLYKHVAPIRIYEAETAEFPLVKGANG